VPTFSLGFIGAGNMAEAIARGVIRAGLYLPAQIQAADPAPARRALFNDDLRVQCGENCADVAESSQIIILAVKPQVMTDALAQIKAKIASDTLIISIAAGISCAFIESNLSPGARVIRVMPNTPMLVGAGISGIARSTAATDADVIAAEQIFRAGGDTLRIPESQMNALTALSGSGPAYIFYLAEAMAAAGVAAGLSEQDSKQLARQTVIGAAELLKQSPDDPAELRRKVTSPGGTTQAAIETLQAGDFIGLMSKAIAAADRRGKELGK
jgi:pyrroline-5-carboxylate reductase